MSSASQPIIVHHLNQSRAHRIVWLLEELGVPYTLRRYQRDPKTMLAPVSLRAIHPLGKSPVISDPNTLGVDGAPLVLAESGAIIEHLAAQYGDGRLMPAARAPERLRITYWLHYAEGSIMPLLLLRLVFDRVKAARVPFFIRPIVAKIDANVSKAFITPQCTLHLDYLEAELAKNPSGWFVGNTLTVADIQMSYPIEESTHRAGLDARRPNLMAFLQRIRERDAYRRAQVAEAG